MHVGSKNTMSVPNAVCGVRSEGKVQFTELAGSGIQLPIWISGSSAGGQQSRPLLGLTAQ